MAGDPIGNQEGVTPDEDVRRDHEHLRSLLESARGFGLVRFALDPSLPHGARIEFASDSLKDILGVDDPSDLAEWMERVVPEDRQMLGEAQRRAAETGEEFSQIVRFDHPRKGTVWIQATGNAVFDASGEPVCFNGIMIDVTHQKLAEQRYVKLFSDTHDAIVIHDLQGGIVDVNLAASELTGYDRRELLSMSIQQLHTPESLRENQAALQALERKGVARLEGDFRRKDGMVFPGEVTASLIEFEGHKLVQAVARNVSERKRVEAQLRAAQRMEAVGRLAGGIAHDFNNLLSAVTGYSDIVLHDLGPDDPARADVEEIARAAKRAAELTNQLLAFSRHQVLEPRVIDLDQVVQGMEPMLRRLIGEDIELRVEPAGRGRNVRADPARIEQVILNLVVNARDAMPDGGKLDIETSVVELDAAYVEEHVDTREGEYVMLAVSDAGCGIDEETRERIFEPFFTTKKGGRGTGLGLSTVYGIVKQSGGFVWVYSNPGRGTTFKVYLPRVKEAVEPVAEPVFGDTRGSETILVVEDDRVLRQLIGRMLRVKGYRVLEAADGDQARSLCTSQGGPVDLVLTDVVMPRMSGRELAEALVAQTPGLKVLYMSGYTDNAIVHHGVLDEGVSFLQKPFSSATLAAKVRQVLDKK